MEAKKQMSFRFDPDVATWLRLRAAAEGVRPVRVLHDVLRAEMTTHPIRVERS